MEDLGKLENKAVDLDDPDGLERKAADEHERRKRDQFEGTAQRSLAGGDVAHSQRRRVASGATRVEGNLQDNGN